MKIFYLINSRIPTEKAEGIEAMKLCEALAKTAEVVMVAPVRFNKIKEDPFSFYNIEKKFRLVRLPAIDLIPFFNSKIIFWLEAVSFAAAAFFYLLFFSKKEDVIFSHDQISLYPATFIRKWTIYDIHDFPRGRLNFYRRLFKNLAGVITTNRWKRQKLISDFGLTENKVISQPNGVDLAKFDLMISKEEARVKFGLPQEKILVGYVGMLKTMSMEKGIETAIRSLKYLSNQTFLVLVGGRKEDIEEYKKVAEDAGLSQRTIFVGWVKHETVPSYLKAFDVLIAPFPKQDHYDYYMCPMKILEYMASGRPIVTSDLNSIREIISEEESVLVRPDNVEALAEGIKSVLNDQPLAEKKSARAFEKLKNFSWDKRAQIILNFIDNTKNLPRQMSPGGATKI
ncbi:MAG: glycosyltransferase family 4 protein [Parcubacteria group bacterium]